MGFLSIEHRLFLLILGLHIVHPDNGQTPHSSVPVILPNYLPDIGGLSETGTLSLLEMDG